MVLLLLEYKLHEGTIFGSFLHCCILGIFNSACLVVVNICSILIALGCDSKDYLSISRTFPPFLCQICLKMGIWNYPVFLCREKSESCCCGSVRWLCFLCVQVLKGIQMSSDKQQYLFYILSTPLYRLPS